MTEVSEILSGIESIGKDPLYILFSCINLLGCQMILTW